MASTKLVALFFFAFAVAAAILPQPSEARPHATASSPPPPSQPTECLTPLIGMIPCMNYLTNLTVLTPPTTCCDGLKSIIKDAPICLCHGMNGDLNNFMPQRIDPARMMMLPLACGAMPPLQVIFSCNTLTVPPIMPSVPTVPSTTSP